MSYSSTDSSGNSITVYRQIVVSNDTTPPVITLNGNSEIQLQVGDTYEELGATANDNQDLDITSLLVVQGDVDTTKIGSYTITYDVEDLSFNPAPQVTRTVTVGTPGNEDSLDVWTQTYLSAQPADLQLPLADPDVDGMANFLEYALGSNPLTPNSVASLPKVSEDSGYLTITFFRLKSSVDNKITYTPQLARSLSNPTWDAASLTVALHPQQENLPSDDYELVTATANVKMSEETDGQQFIRILIERED
jgi:hypothetical protein